MKSANDGVFAAGRNAVVDVDRRFFKALRNVDMTGLDRILTDGFLIILGSRHENRRLNFGIDIHFVFSDFGV